MSGETISDRLTRTPRESGLVVVWDPRRQHDRAELAGLVRGGMRALRIPVPVHLRPSAPRRSASFASLLLDAAGVGLRVSWRGQCELRPDGVLRHVDPPVHDDGTPAWPVPALPLLTARYGPDFVQIEDSRDGTARRYIVDEEPKVAELRRFRSPGPVNSAADRAALHGLAEQGLMLLVGATALTLPVRFRYARG